MMAELRKNAAFVAEALRQTLRQGHTAVLVVSSNSMAPLLWCGDEVVLTAVVPPHPQPGAIFTYVSGAELITHRCVDQVEGGWRLRGDRSAQFDPPVAPAQLLGRVCGRRRNGRFLSLDVGSGGWLNGRLARLAQWEERWLLRQWSAPLPLWLKIARRLLFAWAWFICALVEGIDRMRVKRDNEQP